MKAPLPGLAPAAALVDAKSGAQTTHGKRYLESLDGAVRSTQSTLSDVLDFISGGAQGSILYRGATDWTWLAPGTAGQVLKTNGPGNDPAWLTPAVGGCDVLGTQTVSSSVASVNFSGTWSDYKRLELFGVNIAGTATSTPSVRISADNGSSFATFNYAGFGQSNGSPIAGSFSQADILVDTASVTSAVTDLSFRLTIHGSNVAGVAKHFDSVGGIYNAGTETMAILNGYSSAAFGAVNYIRFQRSAGDVAAGRFTLLGYR